MIFLIIW